MPITIIKKKVTEPSRYTAHKSMVPLRCVKVDRSGDWKEEDKSRSNRDALGVEIGDICFSLDGHCYGEVLFNVTTGRLIWQAVKDRALYVRACEIQSIILTNDDEPAPVL